MFHMSEWGDDGDRLSSIVFSGSASVFFGNSRSPQTRGKSTASVCRHCSVTSLAAVDVLATAVCCRAVLTNSWELEGNISDMSLVGVLL